MGQGEQRGSCVRRCQDTEDLCIHQLTSSSLFSVSPTKNSDEPASWLRFADASPVPEWFFFLCLHGLLLPSSLYINVTGCEDYMAFSIKFKPPPFPTLFNFPSY